MTEPSEMTTGELARRYGVARSTVVRAMERGRVTGDPPPEPTNTPGGSWPRYPVAAMDAWWPRRPDRRGHPRCPQDY